MRPKIGGKGYILTYEAGNYKLTEITCMGISPFDVNFIEVQNEHGWRYYEDKRNFSIYRIVPSGRRKTV